MPTDNDLILRGNQPSDNEWEDLNRFDVETLLKECKKKIDAVVQQVLAQSPKSESTPKKNSCPD